MYLKLKIRKYNFFQEKLVYLGYLLSSGGIKPDPSKTEVIRKYPSPTNADDVRSFLGPIGLYRQFIEHFAETAKLLSDLLSKKG